jgi:hypothetical protein
MLRRACSAALALALVATSLVVGLAAAPAAQAAPVASDPVSYQVTFVARQCPTYADIMANRARNNIQESLRDLGKDTVYTNGSPVRPEIEGPNNPACTPLDDWQFRLGTGYTGKTPATDYLSTVTGDYGQTIRVQDTTPELDAQGQDTGRTLRAAVTVTLTADQAQRAQQASRLWTQGGLKADPLMNSVFGTQYGFGALRCAIDNLNGDNVEWIGYPQGSHHVFCYYYAVTPPPDAGTIVVQKRLAAGSNGPATFRYVGNISYTSNSDFFLTPQDDTTPVSASFVRAAGDAWDFEERPTDGFTQTSLTCTETSGSGSSWTIAGAKATVRVGDGATVTCTYVNTEVQAASGFLQLSKVTYGGVGSFDYLITRGDSTTLTASATTTTEGEPVVIANTDASAVGTWSVRETLPAPTARGTWSIESVQCDGTDVPFVETPGPAGTTYVTASKAIGAGDATDCYFANTFTPGGELQLAKRTSGGTGTFAFPVVRADQIDEDGTVTDLFSIYAVDVTSTGTATDADAVSGFATLTDLPVGEAEASTYLVSELAPPDSPTASWRFRSVSCTDLGTGDPVPVSGALGGRALRVELTDAHPRVRCVADNALQPVGGLDVTKTIAGAGAGAQGEVSIAIACQDGTEESLVVPAGSTGTTALADTIALRDPTTCTVTETANGVRSEAPAVTTTMSVNGGDDVPTTSAAVDVESGQLSSVGVINVYDALAPSGASPATPAYALVGLLLLLLGGAAYALGSRA